MDEFCCGALSGTHHKRGGGRWEVTKDPARLVDFLHPKGDEGGKGRKGEKGPGGFLRVTVRAEGAHSRRPAIVFDLHDAAGEKMYSFSRRAE